MIGTNDQDKRALSKEDRQRALLLIAELKARGLPIPAGLDVPDTVSNLTWNLDANGYFVRNDGVSFRPRDVLVDFIESRARFILMKSGRGGGKALWVETPILTQNRGWTTMGDIQVGDYVFSPDGKPSGVIFTSPVMYNHETYHVVFSDGTWLVADAEHLWEVEEKSSHNRLQTKVLTTKDMLDSGLINTKNVYRYNIINSEALEYPEMDFPIHPYILGVWLGDGSSRDPVITISPKDLELVTHLEHFGAKLHQLSDVFSWSMADTSTKAGSFIENLRSVGVHKNKHIPSQYLYGSKSQRLLLLQGLMDTDGTISAAGHCSFDNKNERLARGVRYLLSSLGIKSTIHRYEITQFGTPTWSYKVSFTVDSSTPVFRLNRKFQRQLGVARSDVTRRAIVDIQLCSSVPVKCIEVDNPSHLFLAGENLIPTHNTASGVQKALKKIKEGKSGAVMNPDFENFRSSTWPELQKWIPWQMVVPKHRYRAAQDWEAIRPFTIVFLNGAKMYCKGLKDPESARGANLNWFWYDEGRRDPTGLGWKNAIAFLRVGEEPQAWCTTTMAGLDHWTNTFFEGKNTEEVESLMAELKAKGVDQPLFEVFKTSTRENSENLDPVFYASLVSAYPAGHLRTREIEGEAADEGGSLGDRRWFDGRKLKEKPDWAMKWVRFWDLAATEAKILRGKKLNDPDETIGSLLGMNKPVYNQDPEFVIADQFGGCWGWEYIKEMILHTAKSDIEELGYVNIFFEQEPASGGKNQVAELKQWLKAELEKRWRITSGYKIDSIEAKKLGDRVLAANTWFAEATTSENHRGQFWIVDGLWNEKFFQQLDTFDGQKHDDRVTSITGARHAIAPIKKKWSSVKFLSLGGK